MSTHHSPPTPFAAFVGIDWADREHAVCIIANGQTDHLSVPHSAEQILAWLDELRQQVGPGPIAVTLEQKRGPLPNLLCGQEQLVLFPINPLQLASYRKSLFPSRRKNDPDDAWLLARFLQEHLDQLRPLQPHDQPSRKLGELCKFRRKGVDFRKKLVQQLTAVLKEFFPQPLQWPGSIRDERTLALLQRWPSLRELQRAHPQIVKKVLREHGLRSTQRGDEFVRDIRAATPLTTDQAVIQPSAEFVLLLVKQLRALNASIARFDEQIAQLFAASEDAELFRQLPGAGAALAPRLASFFGTNRNRFSCAEEISISAGIAPIEISSGTKTTIAKRVACNKFLRQTFQEFADYSRLKSRWARAYYQLQRSRGKKHHAAVRALAFKWIRILFHLWKHRVPYDEHHHIEQLKKSNSPVIPFLEPN